MRDLLSSLLNSSTEEVVDTPTKNQSERLSMNTPGESSSPAAHHRHDENVIQSNSADNVLNRGSEDDAAWKQEYAQRLLEAAIFAKDFSVRRKLYQTALKYENQARKMTRMEQERSNVNHDENLVIITDKPPTQTSDTVHFVLDITDDEDLQLKKAEEVVEMGATIEDVSTLEDSLMETLDVTQYTDFGAIDESIAKPGDTSPSRTDDKEASFFVLDMSKVQSDEQGQSQEKMDDGEFTICQIMEDCAVMSEELGEYLWGTLAKPDDGSSSDGTPSCTSWSCGGSYWSYSTCGGSYCSTVASQDESIVDELVVSELINTTPSTKEQKPPKLVWKQIKDPNTGKTYYYHRVTRQTTWTEPDQEQLRQVVHKKEDKQALQKLGFESAQAKPPKPTWRSSMSHNMGRAYYYNRLTRQSTWTKPPKFDKEQTKYDNAVKSYRASLKPKQESEFERWCQKQEEKFQPVRLLINKGGKIETVHISSTIGADDLLGEKFLEKHQQSTENRSLLSEASHEFSIDDIVSCGGGQEALLVEQGQTEAPTMPVKESKKKKHGVIPLFHHIRSRSRSEKKTKRQVSSVLLVSSNTERNANDSKSLSSIDTVSTCPEEGQEEMAL